MSADAVKHFRDGEFDFVYIDANHDDPYIGDDIRAWSPKVRSGGIVAGHDYMIGHPDVMRAVDDYAAQHEIHPAYLVGNPAEHDNPDLICSWFWVQP